MTDRRRPQVWDELRAEVESQVRAAYVVGPGAVVSVVLTLLERYERTVEAELRARTAQFEAQIAALAADVAALKATAAKDSHNSGKPPSSDVTRTGRAPQSLRGKPGTSGKRSGGQPGHPGRTLALRAGPEVVVTHAPTHCAGCARPFSPDQPSVLIPGERRQVFDLPPSRLVVTEHQVHARCCPACDTRSRGGFPPEVASTVQYGPELRALAVYLTTQQLLPVARASEMLAHLAGQAVSVATVLAAEARCTAALASITARIRAGLAHAPVVHLDETGFFVGRRRHWLHTLSTATLTHYTPHAKRGGAAHEAIGLLPTYMGTAVHDGFESYFTYPCRHALCGVHLLRELTFLAEEGGERWAAALASSLRTMKRAVDRAKAAGATALDRHTAARYRRRYATLLAEGEAAHPTPPSRRTGHRGGGRPRRSPAGRLLYRLRRDRDAVLRFLADFRVPFDNNEAERDLRMMKVEQKISGGFRTPHGAATFCTIRGYLATARKQGRSALDALRDVFHGHPFIPAIPAGAE